MLQFEHVALFVLLLVVSASLSISCSPSVGEAALAHSHSVPSPHADTSEPGEAASAYPVLRVDAIEATVLTQQPLGLLFGLLVAALLAVARALFGRFLGEVRRERENVNYSMRLSTVTCSSLRVRTGSSM